MLIDTEDNVKICVIEGMLALIHQFGQNVVDVS
jgi:hypothetical protein